MFKQFDNYISSLSTLKETDRSYLLDVNAYESKISSGMQCYNTLIADGKVTRDNPQVSSAYDFYEERQGRIDTIKNILVPELQKIADAEDLVARTKQKLKTTNSSQEMSTIFNSYTSAVIANKYPEASLAGKRNGDHQKTLSDSNNDKQVDTFAETCVTLGGPNSGNGNNGGGSGGGI